MPTKSKYTRKRRRSNKNFVAIPINTQQALGTLADETVLTFPLTTAFGEDLFCISADLLISTDAMQEGPLGVGAAHGDYTVAEIKEYVDANLTDPDDKIAQERARRQIRRVGLFPSQGNNEVLNDGKPIRVKLKFSVGDTKTLNVWAMNHSGGALTTGATLTVTGTIYGRWQR